MPRVSSVENKIYDSEGFKVTIMRNGSNVRSDASLPVQYASQRMTINSFTVSRFKTKFTSQYAGYDVEVLYADGTPASGQTLLSTVRESYK